MDVLLEKSTVPLTSSFHPNLLLGKANSLQLQCNGLLLLLVWDMNDNLIIKYTKGVMSTELLRFMERLYIICP